MIELSVFSQRFFAGIEYLFLREKGQKYFHYQNKNLLL